MKSIMLSSSLNRCFRLTVALTFLALTVSVAMAHDSVPKEDAPADVKGLEQVQTFRSEGRAHLDPGEKWEYGHYPPTSGPHDPKPVKPAFYKIPQAPEKLVHSLEHGNIVIYYETPAPSVLAQLNKWQKRYGGKWDGIIVTPLPGLGDVVILTAWTKMLRLDPFDPGRAKAFIDAFRGKGPEHGQNEMQ
ncbi:DUF3105 domain-containing protein [Geomonas paludis]|uniref:DUF3105 domain-containing protein n=1 Tax=Geomonas paludis TaxID=2740185 RepID=A0A6V8N285_9BACT|nr:DUF3105 domain-containing protein [Geomonas paludis]UPU35148.1 DUF3105 domain-containing protein [Geomonas paludis]GFO65469.1 hypothetical protein GMPD_33880 [Geomonas paludis]